jgi:hypothetical protein
MTGVTGLMEKAPVKGSLLQFFTFTTAGQRLGAILGMLPIS